VPKTTGSDMKNPRVFAKATGFTRRRRVFSRPQGPVRRWLFGQRSWRAA
jgi:hypothetical protein